MRGVDSMQVSLQRVVRVLIVLLALESRVKTRSQAHCLQRPKRNARLMESPRKHAHWREQAFVKSQDPEPRFPAVLRAQ